MLPPTASPNLSGTVGLKNMVIAPLTLDNESTVTYDELQLVAGAIEATITPENSAQPYSMRTTWSLRFCTRTPSWPLRPRWQISRSASRS